MVVHLPASKARVTLGEILERVERKGDEIVIERLGKPVAKVIPYTKLPRNVEWLRAKLARYAKGADAAAAVRSERDRDEG